MPRNYDSDRYIMSSHLILTTHFKGRCVLLSLSVRFREVRQLASVKPIGILLKNSLDSV